MLYGFSPFLGQLSFLYADKHQQHHVMWNFVFVCDNENWIVHQQCHGYDIEEYIICPWTFVAKYQHLSMITIHTML
jgi:hypothetical protein